MGVDGGESPIKLNYVWSCCWLTNSLVTFPKLPKLYLKWLPTLTISQTFLVMRLLSTSSVWRVRLTIRCSKTTLTTSITVSELTTTLALFAACKLLAHRANTPKSNTGLAPCVVFSTMALLAITAGITANGATLRVLLPNKPARKSLLARFCGTFVASFLSLGSSGLLLPLPTCISVVACLLTLSAKSLVIKTISPFYPCLLTRKQKYTRVVVGGIFLFDTADIVLRFALLYVWVFSVLYRYWIITWLYLRFYRIGTRTYILPKKLTGTVCCWQLTNSLLSGFPSNSN